MKNGIAGVLSFTFLVVCTFIVVCMYLINNMTTGEMNRAVNIKATIEEEMRAAGIEGMTNAVNKDNREVQVLQIDTGAARSAIESQIRAYVAQYNREVEIKSLSIDVRNEYSATIKMDYIYKPIVKSDKYQSMNWANGNDEINLSSKVKIKLTRARAGNSGSDTRDKYNISGEQVGSESSDNTYGGRTYNYIP